ncbi:DUF4352 domain-containing protein [Corynebacterium glyciniphilum]|uniref:DUF4352 domain-containing protein n=1 Tax=Corynebacterium glyciniphilum TaxID=1404244 RepID=UPI0011AB4CE9|nr:DUF4352 domain-containing protein [Corynebacterium glyciniphilum]
MTDQNQYGQPQQQAEPQKKPFYKRVWFIILLVIVVIIVLASALSGGDDDDSSASDNSSSSQDNGGDGEGQDEGNEGGDGTAQLGDTVHTDKADITASNLRPSTSALGGEYLCVDVSFDVTGEDSLSLNGAMDWKLTDPNGVTHNQTFTEEANYDTVEVGPGGNYSGTACFESASTPGDYRLNFEEAMSFLNSAEAEWNATL